MSSRTAAICAICLWLSISLFGQTDPTTSASSSTAGKAKTVVVTELQNGKDIELTRDDTLVVHLEANRTTGYSWTVAGNPAPLKLLTSTYKNSAEKAPMGAPGTQELKFAAPSAGTASLMLQYRRPWEHDAASAKTFKVTVRVH